MPAERVNVSADRQKSEHGRKEHHLRLRGEGWDCLLVRLSCSPNWELSRADMIDCSAHSSQNSADLDGQEY